MAAPRGLEPVQGHTARQGATFALIEALEKRLEFLLIQDGTLCVSLPQGHPCLLQPGNLRRADCERLATGHPAEGTPRLGTSAVLATTRVPGQCSLPFLS